MGEDSVAFSALPGWAERFITNLDDRFDLCAGETADANFPDGAAPRWLRTENHGPIGGAPSWIDDFFVNAESRLQELWIENGLLRTDPDWLAALEERDRASVARVFLLTGNIYDYAFSPEHGYRPVNERIEENAVQRKDWVIRYSLSNGFDVPKRGDSVPDGTASPLEDLSGDERRHGVDRRSRNPLEVLTDDFRLMEDILWESYDGGVCLIIENLQNLLSRNSGAASDSVLTDAILRWAQSPRMFRSENQVVLLADSDDSLNEDLLANGNHIERIDIPRPEAARDRLKFLISLFATNSVGSMSGVRFDGAARPRFGSGFDNDLSTALQRLADRTSGLNLVGLENLALQVNVREDRTFTMEYIKEAKRDIIAQESGGLLEVSEPDVATERDEAFAHIGGLDPVCDKLLQISQLMDAGSESELVRRSLPNGLLFLGPPGTGKTLVARAFADACGVNFAQFGNIRSMWVGESERNLSKALDLLRSLTPVIVFMDEIDQRMGQRGGSSDSGVDQRLFARILQFMSDPELEGEVIWIAASNEPSLIDSALKRAGRFDLTIPFLRPDADARRDILSIQFQERGAHIDLHGSQWEHVLSETEGYTGAELEGVAKGAIWNRLVDGVTDEPVDIPFELVEKALSEYQPPVNREQYQQMEDEALLETTAVDILSPAQRKRRERLIEELH